VTTPIDTCTHGADCTMHPDVNGVHNFDPTAADVLTDVLQWAIEHDDYEAQEYVRSLAARLSLLLPPLDPNPAPESMESVMAASLDQDEAESERES
jgi:hypothetical protein